MLLDFETEKISVLVSSLRLKHFQSQSCHCASFFLVSFSIIQIWSQVCVCLLSLQIDIFMREVLGSGVQMKTQDLILQQRKLPIRSLNLSYYVYNLVSFCLYSRRTLQWWYLLFIVWWCGISKKYGPGSSPGDRED